MRALMSLCNVGLFNSQFSLAAVDTDSGAVELVDCTGFVDPARDAGVTGLVRLDDGALVLVVQSARPKLVFLEPDFTVRKIVRDERFSDLHSLTVRDGFVFITSTGNNKILKVALDTFLVTLFWEYPIERPYLHINALAFNGERPVVASHKLPPECPVGGGVSSGCWRLDDFEVVLPDLKQPHTLISDGAALHCLSSNDGRVLTWRAGEVEEHAVPGYLRGLMRAGGGFLVGASSRRFISRKKDGVHLYTDFSDVIGNPVYMSGLVKTDADFAPQARTNTTLAGFEIFEIMADPGVPEARRRSDIGPLRMQTMQRLLVSVREEAQRSREAGAAA